MTRCAQNLKRTRASRTTCAESAPDLHPMIATKLWENPCWLSFRINFIAHQFNQPLYDWIERRYRPHAARASSCSMRSGLKDGITADDIAASSSRPKNTLSRAIQTACCARSWSAARAGPVPTAAASSLYLTRSGPPHLRGDRAAAGGARAGGWPPRSTPPSSRCSTELLDQDHPGKSPNWPEPSEQEEFHDAILPRLSPRPRSPAALPDAASSLALAQTLTIGVRGGPDSIDPHFTATGTHAEALKHVFDTLVWSGDGLRDRAAPGRELEGGRCDDVGVQAAQAA